MWISSTQEVIHNRVIAYMEKMGTFLGRWALFWVKPLKTKKFLQKKQCLSSFEMDTEQKTPQIVLNVGIISTVETF